jgi:hypothetical protein
VLKLITYCNKLDRELPQLLKSIDGKIPYECHIISGKFTWNGVVDWLYGMTRKYSEDTLIVVDAYDTLFVGDPEELGDLSGVERLTFCASKVCWPDPEKACRYPCNDSPWKYLNGGVMIGNGQAIHQAIEWGWRQYPILPASRHASMIFFEDNDQRFWTDLYLDGYGSLDTQCEIFQNLVGIEAGDVAVVDGRFTNLITETRPHFIHAAARTWNLIPKELYESS